MKAIVYRSKENKVVVSSKKLCFYEFDKSYDPVVSDDKPITAMEYSPIHMEFYTGAGRTIKCWDAMNGILARIFKDVTPSEITALSLDNNQRVIFYGTLKGNIGSIDVLTGFRLKEFPEHQKEVSFLRYSINSNLFISSSWDR